MTSVFFLLKNFFLCKSVLYKNFFIYLRIEKQPFCCGLDSSNAAFAVKNYNEGGN